MKKVSIIVPFFNGLMYAKDCLDSIMDQGLAFEEYEVICLGDAPEEGIVTIIENYENLGMPVRYVQWFENKGKNPFTRKMTPFKVMIPPILRQRGTIRSLSFSFCGIFFHRERWR